MNEMAIETGLNDNNNYSGKSDWDYYKEHRKFIKLLKDKITSKKYKLYVSGLRQSLRIYFLVSEDEEYVGSMQIDEIRNEGHIKTSHSTIKGFYQLMFTLLLMYYKKIFSDVSLSTQAIGSYEKLSKSKLFKVQILTDKGVEDFNRNKLLKYPGNQVQITETQKGFIKEHFNDYYKRIHETQESGLPGIFKRMFLESDENLDLFLLGKKLM